MNKIYFTEYPGNESSKWHEMNWPDNPQPLEIVIEKDETGQLISTIVNEGEKTSYEVDLSFNELPQFYK